MLQAYIAGSIACLTFSVFPLFISSPLHQSSERSEELIYSQTWCHTVAAHSESVAKRFLKLDYLGILLNVTACAVSFIYVGLYERPGLQTFYISLFVICATFAFSATLSSVADGPQAAFWR